MFQATAQNKFAILIIVEIFDTNFIQTRLRIRLADHFGSRTAPKERHGMDDLALFVDQRGFQINLITVAHQYQRK